MDISPASSKRFRHIGALLFILILVGCGSSQPTSGNDGFLGREHITPASHIDNQSTRPSDLAANAAEVEGIPTAAPAFTYDPDGDGFMDTTTLITAVEDSWEGYTFPPGYQFAIERFRTEFDTRIETEGEERWQMRFNDNIVSIAQTCAWMEYWIALQASSTGNDVATRETNRMFTEVFPQNFVFAEMRDTMVQIGNYVVLGDMSSVQEFFVGMHCEDAYFRPDWSGPKNSALTSNLHWRNQELAVSPSVTCFS